MQMLQTSQWTNRMAGLKDELRALAALEATLADSGAMEVSMIFTTDLPI